LDAKALSPKKRKGCDYPDHGLENNDNARPTEDALEEMNLIGYFILAKIKALIIGIPWEDNIQLI